MPAKAKASPKTKKQRPTKRSLSSSAPRAPRPKAKKLTLSIGRTKLTITVKQTKRRKKSSKKPNLKLTMLMIVAGLFGTVFFGLQALAAPAPKLTAVASSQTVTPAPVKQFMGRSEPTELRIPDIQLDTTLTTVGLQSNGTIEVPAQYTQAGWYTASPTPGEQGPSIIVGHLDNIHGLAVFWRLRELVPGQTIEVSRQDGSVAKFVINQVKQFPQDNFPTADVYGNTSSASLRLITCGGSFNRLTGHYDQNTVVFASLVQPN